MGPLQRLRKSAFARDSAILQVATVFNNFGNLASAFLLAHLLGASRQGEFYLAIATYSFLWFTVNLGLYPVTTSQVAAAAARENRYKVAFWLAYLLKAYLVLGLAVGALAFLALPTVTQLLFDDRQVGLLAALLTLTPLVDLPRAVCCAGLQGTRRMLTLAKVENGQEAVRVFLVVAGAVATGDALGPVLGMLGGSAFGSLLALDAYRRESRLPGSPLPPLRYVFGRVREAPLLHGLPLGLRMGLAQNLHAYGVNILPSIILAVFGDKAWVAYLRLGQRFVDAARIFMQGINRAALPYFSELVGTRDLAGLERAYWRATLSSGLLISSGVLLSIPVLPWLIDFFPRDYHDPVWTIFLILVPGVIVVSFSVTNDTFYLVTDNLRTAVVLGVVQLVVNVIMSTLLAYYYPTVGTAIALSFFFVSSVVHPTYAGLWFRRHRSAPPGGGGAALEPSRAAAR